MRIKLRYLLFACVLLLASSRFSFADYSYTSISLSPNSGEISNAPGLNVNVVLNTGLEDYTSVSFDLVYPNTVSYYSSNTNSVSYTNGYSCKVSSVDSYVTDTTQKTSFSCSTTDINSVEPYNGTIVSVKFTSTQTHGTATIVLENVGDIDSVGSGTYTFASTVIPNPPHNPSDDTNGMGGADTDRLPQTSKLINPSIILGLFLIAVGGVLLFCFSSDGSKKNRLKLRFVDKI